MFKRNYILFYLLLLIGICNICFADDDDDKTENKTDTKKESKKEGEKDNKKENKKEVTRTYKQMLQEVIKTEVVYPQDQGEVQTTFVPIYIHGHDDNSATLPLIIEYGITNNWQIDFEGEAYIWQWPNMGENTRGPGDIAVGTKYSFMNIKGTPYHAAVSFDIVFPTGNINKNLTDGFRRYEPAVEFARDFPNFHNSQLFSQVGFSFVDRVKQPSSSGQNSSTQNSEEDFSDQIPVDQNSPEIEPPADSFFVNIGYFLPVDNTRYVIEVNWENNRWNHNGTSDQLYLTPGLVWELPKEIELSLGTSIGLTANSDIYQVIARATYEFNLF